MTTSTHATTFLVTHKTPPQDRFFQGYCFHGADYVYGEDGVKKFEASTGRKVTGGLDGCYALVRRDGDSIVFTNDYAGYKVLFYYHDGSTWAVSNSLAQIVDFLRVSQIKVTPNYAQLSSILSAGSASSQLFSFQTVVQNVRLVPRATNLVITREKARLDRWPAVAKKEYATSLGRHLDLWAGRFETLILDDRIGLTTDVTGGVDSRTNFGLLALAKKRLGGGGDSPRLNCGSTPENTEDLDVALKLGERFGLEINDQRRFTRYNLTPEESYQTFRDLNTGASYNLYTPVEGPHPYKISIGGGGGEIHRKFYEGHIKSKDINRFVLSYSSRLKYPWLAGEFAKNCREALDYAALPGMDPLRVHYREFRHRFHVGRAPRYGVSFTPLDSASADLTQSQAGQSRLDDGQFNYDVLVSLNPELIEIPFDKPSKAPSASVRSRLTRVEVSPDARPGQVWATAPDDRTVARPAVQRYEKLQWAVETAAVNPFVVDFWGPEVVDSASGLLDRLVSGAGIGNAVNGKPITALLAADLASPSH